MENFYDINFYISECHVKMVNTILANERITIQYREYIVE